MHMHAYLQMPHTDRLMHVCETQVNGAVDVLPLDVGATIAESVQDYVTTWNASFLIIGCSGEHFEADRDKPESIAAQQQEKQQQHMGRVAKALLFSPRCATCICV